MTDLGMFIFGTIMMVFFAGSVWVTIHASLWGVLFYVCTLLFSIWISPGDILVVLAAWVGLSLSIQMACGVGYVFWRAVTGQSITYIGN